MSTPSPTRITLAEIARRKTAVQQEIEQQKEAMATTARHLFAPLQPAANKADALIRSFNIGMSIFDGAMMGFKIIGKLRSFFRYFHTSSPRRK